MTWQLLGASGGFTGEIPVIALHTEDPTNLIKAALRRGFTPIWLSELVDAIEGRRGLPAQPIALTFDDGAPSWISTTHPVLVAYDFKATMCLTSDYLYQVDLAIFADTGITWDQARTMHATGLYDWQNHGQSHATFTSLAAGALQEELAECSRAIQDELGVPKPRAVIYPNGAHSAAVLDTIATAGYALGLKYSNIETDRPSVFPGTGLLTVNRSGGSGATGAAMLRWASQRVIHDAEHDMTHGRNAANVLGYWTLPTNATLADSGEAVQIDSTVSALAIEAITADHYRVDSRRLQSWVQVVTTSHSAGTAKVTIKQYDKDLGALADIDIASLTTNTAATVYDGMVTLHDDCQFVRLSVSGDASFTGVIKATRWTVVVA